MRTKALIRAGLFKGILPMVLFFGCLYVGAVASRQVSAAIVTGWLWGGSEESPDRTINGNETSLGWISMSSAGCDSDKNGYQDANCGGNNTNTPFIDYHVTIPEGDGLLNGYGWSEHLGWIQFDHGGPYPAGPNHSVKRQGDTLIGWARILSIRDAVGVGNSGGWQGWIKMSGANYGVKISDMDGTGNNPTYAWSDELGWIDFSRAKVEIPPKLAICKACNGNAPLEGLVIDIDDLAYQVKACEVPVSSTTCDGVDRTSIVQWKSSDSNVATVASGSIDPQTVGSTIITASYSSLTSDTLPVQVTCDPACDPALAAQKCTDETFRGTKAGCPTLCRGTKVCSSGWQEVTP